MVAIDDARGCAITSARSLAPPISLHSHAMIVERVVESLDAKIVTGELIWKRINSPATLHRKRMEKLDPVLL
jgi:hypothetical protein